MKYYLCVMEKRKPYNDLGDFLRKCFAWKVQKISINAGFTCPNRDGTKGWGGCTYCNNQTFSPEYCHTEKSVTEQLEEGVHFFSRKYPEMKYLAYFQAYTNTYDSMEALKKKYEEALAFPGVVGLIVGTRPDCMPDELLDYFTTLSKHTFVMIEYGVESTKEETLLRINRGYSSDGGSWYLYRSSFDIRITRRKQGRYLGTCPSYFFITAHNTEVTSAPANTEYTDGERICRKSV